MGNTFDILQGTRPSASLQKTSGLKSDTPGTKWEETGAVGSFFHLPGFSPWAWLQPTSSGIWKMFSRDSDPLKVEGPALREAQKELHCSRQHSGEGDAGHGYTRQAGRHFYHVFYYLFNFFAPLFSFKVSKQLKGNI